MTSPQTSQETLIALLETQISETERERDRIEARLTELRALLEAHRAARPQPPQRAAAVLARAASPQLDVVLTGARQVDLGASLGPAMVPSRELTTAELSSVDVGQLSQLSAEQLDTLAYGVIRLDARGRVLAYNDTESRMAGMPKEQVIGRNFFTDLAPCTRVKDFEGRYRDFVNGRQGLSMESFEFVFRFERGHQRVLIIFTPARYRGQFQVAILRR